MAPLINQTKSPIASQRCDGLLPMAMLTIMAGRSGLLSGCRRLIGAVDGFAEYTSMEITGRSRGRIEILYRRGERCCAREDVLLLRHRGMQGRRTAYREGSA